MVEGQQCPNLSELHQFLLGYLSAEQSNIVQAHLAACPACLGTVENLQAEDTLVGAVRAPRPTVDGTDGEQVAALIQKLSGISRLPEAAADQAGQATSAAESFELRDLLAAPMGTNEIGRLGTYRVLKVLGTGGMGIVFEAEDPQLKRRVALKVMKPELAQNPASRDRFLREAQAAAAIEHDHIVTILQVSEDQGVPFLAMPLLKGETLEDRLKRNEDVNPPQTLPLPEVLRITREIASGLAAAHAQGLTHRDIKPANIWLEKSGRVKILDFGLARPQQDDARLTQTGSIAGTPQYMSPEQAAGLPVDLHSDLFSLGCVLYRLLTGQLPFTGTSTLGVLRALALENPRPPREINRLLPAPLSALTMRLLAKQPQDRPKTAEKVVEALADIERTQAARVRQVDSTPPPLAGRGRRFALLAAIALLLVGPVAIWYSPAVYRFATNQGTLVIQTDDAAVKVTVKQNGELIKIVDRKTGKQVTLKAGTYQLELSRGKPGLKLETDHFTLLRGGREIARVVREPTAPPATPPVAAPAESPALPYAVLASDKTESEVHRQNDSAFASLADAVVAAKSGDTIEVRGNGPMIRESIVVWGKALTIRAAAGIQPVLEFTSASKGAGWDKYVRLQTDAPLTLEGLEIRRVGATGEKEKRAEWAIVCRKAPLHIANCRVVVSTAPKTAAFWADESALCVVCNCQFVLGPGCGSMDWICPEAGRMIWDSNILAGGMGPCCHYRRRAESISVQLTHNTFTSPALHFNLELSPEAALDERNQSAPPYEVEVTANVFNSNYVVGYFQDFPLYVPEAKPLSAADAEALLPRLVAWRGQRNVYSENVGFLALGAIDEPLQQTRVRTSLKDWQQFWGRAETDSLQGRILHIGRDVSTKATTALEQLMPGDFRLGVDSAGKGADEGSRDLGADVDFVGPGPAYERWKQTPAYQEWLHVSGQVP